MTSHKLITIVSATVVISSTGEVAQLAGELLGQYEYDEEKGCYVQSSTDQSNENYIARYLYRDDEDEWVVGPTHGGETFWLWNPNPSKKLPDKGWQILFGVQKTDDVSRWHW